MNLLIRKIRLEKNMSLSTLARMANIAKATLSDIENNKKDPRLSTLEKIANALGVEVKDLF